MIDDSHNPYAPPASDDPARERSAESGDPLAASSKASRKVDDETLGILRGTRTWVSLATVILFVTAVCGVLAILGTIVARMSLPEGSHSAERAMGAAAPFVVPGLMAIYPALKSRAYHTSIDKLLRTRSRRDLAEALRHQRRLWAFSTSVMLLAAAFFGLTLGVMQCAAPQ
jgi:hypothetical protein